MDSQDLWQLLVFVDRFGVEEFPFGVVHVEELAHLWVIEEKDEDVRQLPHLMVMGINKTRNYIPTVRNTHQTNF